MTELDEISSREIMSHQKRRQIIEQINEFAVRSLRVIAVAYRPFDDKPKSLEAPFLEMDNGNEDNGLTFLGLFAIRDPVRPGVRRSVSLLVDD